MNNSLYAEVNKQFNMQSEKKKNEYSERVNAVYEKVPEVKALDDSVTLMIYDMFKKAAAGGDTDAIVEEFSNKLHELKERKKLLLSENGFRPDYLSDIYSCKKCSDTGVYNGKQSECYRKLVAKELLKHSNMSPLLAKQTFSKFDLSLYSDKKNKDGISPRDVMKELLSDCKKFASDFPKGNKNLLFFGGAGLGKTFTSSAIANEVMKKGHTVIYMTAADIFAYLEDIRFSRADDNTKKLMQQIMEVDLLIIDDLGTEFMNAYTDTEFFRILNSRIMNEKSMIISTNHSLQSLKKSYSERIFSRIVGHFNIYKFIGDDIRCKNIL